MKLVNCSMLQPIVLLSVPNYSFTAFAYTIGVILLFLSFVPLSLKTPIPLEFGIDKLGHSFAYFIFSLALDHAFSFDWLMSESKKKVVFIAFSFGLMVEIVQGIGLVYRSFEFYDLLANSIGIFFFLMVGKTIKKIVVKSGIFIN